MEFQDHDYTKSVYGSASPLDFTYKMSSKEIEDFVKLRVSNNDLFTRKRNMCMWAWRTILKYMGLQHKMTHSQASKKWENMKKKYKGLKNPPDGMKVVPGTWPYFSLMDDAMMGRLEGNAPTLKLLSNNKNNSDFIPISKDKKRKAPIVISPTMDLLAGGPEIEVSLNGDEERVAEVEREGCQEMGRIMQDVDQQRNMMEREKQVMEREQLVLQRERAALDREAAALDRDRASLSREKALLERERATVEKDRDAVSRERLALERERARLCDSRDKAEEDGSRVKDLDVMERRERFLNLFEKFIEKF